MNRVLLISPYFVPMNYVGAKRTLCFARHLPAMGWETAVVALPADIERDPALEPLVPPVPMFRGYRGGPVAWLEDGLSRLRSPSPGGAGNGGQPSLDELTAMAQGSWRQRLTRELNGLSFDKYLKYLPWTFLGALRLLRQTGCRAILATAGPFSTLPLAGALARTTGRPLVLDLRDPYSIDPQYSARWTALGHRLARSQEAWSFAAADRIILNTEESLAAYREAYAGRIPAERFTFIRNHFDPELFDPLPPPPPRSGPFRVFFFGHLTAVRNGRLFLQAFRRFLDHEGLAPGEAEFVTLGERTPEDVGRIADLGLAEYVQDHPWVPFTRCRQLLGTADLLLDLTGRLGGTDHYLRVTGKFYDYLACRRPILCVSRSAEMKRILAATRAGTLVDYNPDAIADALSAALAAKRAGRPFEPDATAVVEYTARPAAAKLAAILDEVIR